MKNFIFIPLIVLFIGCTSDSTNSNKNAVYSTPPPPPLPANEQRICDSLMNVAYRKIKNNNIDIIFYDTIKDDKAMYSRFVSIINKIGFGYYRLYGAGFESISHKRCMQPIMDSAIISLYGPNAKDSIIEMAYKLAGRGY